MAKEDRVGSIQQGGGKHGMRRRRSRPFPCRFPAFKPSRGVDPGPVRCCFRTRLAPDPRSSKQDLEAIALQRQLAKTVLHTDASIKSFRQHPKLGSHLAGDFFLGVDILVTSMLVNFLLVCLSVVALPRRNPRLAEAIRFGRGRATQLLVGLSGAGLLGVYLVVHVAKDLRADVDGWYFRSTWIWLLVMALASGIFARKWGEMRRRGVDPAEIFAELPPQ